MYGPAFGLDGGTIIDVPVSARAWEDAFRRVTRVSRARLNLSIGGGKMTMQKDMERRRPAGAQSMGIHYMSMVRKKENIACSLYVEERNMLPTVAYSPKPTCMHRIPRGRGARQRGRKLGIIHASWRSINKQQARSFARHLLLRR